MSLTEFFIRRPAFTLVVSLVFVITGILCYLNLPVRWVPNITPLVVFIQASWPGASANLIETRVTTPIEEALAGVAGVETLSSKSRDGNCFVILQFRLGHDINVAMEDVRSALQSESYAFPEGMKMPSVDKADTDTFPIMQLAFSDQHFSPEQLSDYVRHFVMPALQAVEGVALVSLEGEREPALHLWLDPVKMAAARVTVDDVRQTLLTQNISVPSGSIRGEARLYQVVTNETLHSPDEFSRLIIRDDQNHPIRLRDVGQIIVDAKDDQTAYRVNGKPAIGLWITPQLSANPLSVAENVEKTFQKLSRTLPPSMHGEIVFNQATYIQSSIHHVYLSIFEAVLFVLLVIYLFLASFRAAFIPVITIPVCLIATFSVMAIAGISINTITLMAFVVAIGLVVDDAIVMLENIDRHINAGMPVFQAALRGSREMIFPIIAMTLTLAAVYLPAAFVSGVLGTVFRDFAVTLAGAVMISGVIALTLSPMMSARLLHPIEFSTSRYAQWLHRRFMQWQAQYAFYLRKALAHKKAIIAVLCVIGGLGYLVFQALPSELSPPEDMNEIDVWVGAPRDSSFAWTDQWVKKLEQIEKNIPEITSQITTIDSNSRGSQTLTLQPRNQRSRNASDIIADLNKQADQLAGIKVYISPASTPLTWFSDGSGSSIAVQVMSEMPYADLHALMQRLIARVQLIPGFSNVESGLKWDGNQFELSIDRAKAADLHVPMQDITGTISTMLAGENVGHFEYGGNLYDIIVQMNRDSLSKPNIFSSLYVRNQSGDMLPLGNLISVNEKSTPESLPHFNRLRADILHATLLPGYTIGYGVKMFEKAAAEILPDNARYAFQGDAQSYLESSGKMILLFSLALIFIYLVLVAQFESFIDPLIILLTVPFAMVGALAVLKLLGGSLNIYSEIALITLIGLIAKHGILITEFANRKCREGLSIEDAIVAAAQLRLRPVMMTTAAMVLGVLPLAFAFGPGAETRHQVGWVIVGGLLPGTFFSLIVVPVAYVIFARLKPVVREQKVIVEEEVVLTQ
ncbi:MAG: efflux RND transporter permease subunit [Gammaproteobacteria bacterium]|nr:efflux RND transporter permease subunit [Gammaproteobacteria bacterium]